MAEGGKVITLGYIMDNTHTLRIRLTNAAEELNQKKPNDPMFAHKTKGWMESIFSSSNVNVELEEKADEETTKRNKEKVRKLFKKLHKKLEDQEKNVEKSLEGLTPEQQDAVVNFWQHAFELMEKVFNWIKDMFNIVVEKIKEGFRVAKEAFKEFFVEVWSILKSIYTTSSSY